MWIVARWVMRFARLAERRHVTVPEPSHHVDYTIHVTGHSPRDVERQLDRAYRYRSA